MSPRFASRSWPWRRLGDRLGPPALFLLLSAAFLWQPLLTGQVFLPTDLSFRYDYLWKALESEPGRVVAQNPLLSDVSDYYYPYAVYAIERLRAGHFPLWNPYILTGTPFFAATQAAVLDPVNLLTYLAGPEAYWTWGAWLRLALLGFFIYGFVRALGRSRAAGLAAGVVFMVCGFIVVWLNYSVVTSLVWLPALFWATTRLVQTGRPAWLAATALAMGLLLLGGHPETQFLGGLTWGLYALWSLFATRRTREGAGGAVRRMLVLAGAAALGLALSAVQWAPFADLLLNSSAIGERSAGIPPFDLGQTALRLVVLFIPNFSGNPIDHNYWVPEFTNFNEQTGYFGLLAVGLAALGALTWARRDRATLFFALLGLLGLALAVRAPGFHLVKALPVFNVGHGVRWVILWSFCGAVLAGYGVDTLLAGRPRAPLLRRSGLALAGLAGLGAGGLGVIYLGIHLAQWDLAWGAVLPHSRIDRLFAPGRLTLYWPVLFLAAGAGLVLARWRGWLARPALATLLILLLFADLWLFGSQYNPVTPRSAVFPRNATIDYLAQHLGHDRFVGAVGLMRPNTTMLFGLRDFRGYEDVIDQPFAQLNGALLKNDLEVVNRPALNLTPEDYRLLRVAGVRYVLTVRKLRVAGQLGSYRDVLDKDGVATYEDMQALPRAYLVYSATVSTDLPAATAALLAPGHNPARAVILTGGGAPLAGLSAAPTLPVTWQRDDPEAVVLEATATAPGYLVLSDSYAGGWEATVDAQPAPLLRANVAYRAVGVPAGRHTVGFYYRPRLFYGAAVVSALAGLIILLLAAGAALPHRARQGRAEPVPADLVARSDS